MTQRQFGNWLWGTGLDQAIQRSEAVTRDELDSKNVTLEIVRCWHEFYAKEVTRQRGLPTSWVRARLLEKCVMLLG